MHHTVVQLLPYLSRAAGLRPSVTLPPPSITAYKQRALEQMHQCVQLGCSVLPQHPSLFFFLGGIIENVQKARRLVAANRSIKSFLRELFTEQSSSVQRAKCQQVWNTRRRRLERWLSCVLAQLSGLRVCAFILFPMQMNAAFMAVKKELGR